MTLRILPAATVDSEETEARLESEQEGYGTAFAQLLKAAIAAIRASPRQFSPTADGPTTRETREAFIDRFNQRVIFAVADAEVVILAVVHAPRRPRSWVSRLRQFT